MSTTTGGDGLGDEIPSCSATGEYDYDCPCCSFYEPSYALLFPWMVILMGVGVNFLLIQFQSPVPYAAVIFLLGTVLGAVATVEGTSCCNSFIISTLMWTQIDSNVLLLTILPGLILRDAMEVNFDIFMLASGQLLLLAYPMVLIGTALTGCACFFLLPWDWPWSLTLTLGAILGSTDPIAVASVLKRLGAPPRLQLHLAGESTLNDGSAMVFFNVFSQIWFSSLPGSQTEEITIGQGFALFFQNALGGFSVGLAFAIGLLFALYELDKRMEPEYDILQAGAALTMSYLSYYVADQLLQMSGVTASVTVGILAKAFGRGLMRDEHGMIKYLSLMEFLLNTLLFALGGVIWGALLVRSIVDENLEFSATIEWFWLFVMYLLVMIIRFVQVAIVYPLFKRMGLKSNLKEAIFLSFAGMRGAVGIALSLSLYRKANEATLDSKDSELVNAIFFLTGGISLCTLLFNGTCAAWVLQVLGLVIPNDRKRALRLFEVEAEQYVARKYELLMRLPRFQGASFAAVKEHVPFVSDECLTYILKGEIVGPRGSVLPIDSEFEDSGTSRGHVRRTTDDGYLRNLELQEFSQRIAQYTTKQDSPDSNSLVNDDLVNEIRHMFLDTVCHTYVRKLQEGEIDDDGALVNNPEYMRQFLDDYFLPSASASQGEFNIGTTPEHEYWWNTLEIRIARLLASSRGLKTTKHQVKDIEAFKEYRQNRPIVQRSLAFVAAHRSAEKGFRRYMEEILESKRSTEAAALGVEVGDDKDEEMERTTRESMADSADMHALQEAVETVLDESQEQIRIAEERLLALPAHTVRKVQSHVLASILLKKLTRLVGRCVEDRTLDPKEGQKYFDIIATKTADLKACSGEEILADDNATVCNKDLRGVMQHHPFKKMT